MKIFLNAPNIENIEKDVEEQLFPDLLDGMWVSDKEEADIRIFDHSTWMDEDSPDLSKDILISLEIDEINILKLLNKRPCWHLIGKSKNLIRELGETLKMLQEKKFWTNKEAFGDYQENFRYEFTSSAQIKEKLDYVLNQLNFENYFKYPTDFIRLISNELLMNAFYHGQGRKNRKENVEVKEDPIVFEVGANERGILLRIIDFNGGFEYNKMLSSLIRGFKEKTPRQDTDGAGLGLYFVFNMGNQVIFNVTQNKGTEIISIIEANKRYKHYMQRVSSLHYHLEKK